MLAVIPTFVLADDRPPIATDRPGFSDGSNVVGYRGFQVESGYFRTFLNGGDTISFGDTLIRYGTSKNFEVRVIGLSYGFAPGSTQSFLDPSLGFKYRLQEGSASQPEITFIGQTTVPIGSHPIRANSYNPTAKIAWTKAVGSDTFGGNLVYSKNGPSGGHFDQAAISLFLSHPLNSRLALTPEIWGVNRVAAGGSGGAFASLAGTYLLSADTQIDLRIGSGFNQNRDGWFIQTGVSWRF